MHRNMPVLGLHSLKPELTFTAQSAMFPLRLRGHGNFILSYQTMAFEHLASRAKNIVTEVAELFKCAEQHKATVEVLMIYLLVGGRSFADSSPDFPVVSPSSLRDLSQLTGLHRETLRRRMADAEELGLVQRVSGGYVVADVERWTRAVRIFRREA